MLLDCQNPLDLDLIILELLEPLETLAKRAARSAASIYIYILALRARSSPGKSKTKSFNRINLLYLNDSN